MRVINHNWSATKQRLHPHHKPPFSFVRGQDSTMWDIVWVSPQGHRSVSVSRDTNRSLHTSRADRCHLLSFVTSTNEVGEVVLFVYFKIYVLVCTSVIWITAKQSQFHWNFVLKLGLPMWRTDSLFCGDLVPNMGSRSLPRRQCTYHSSQSSSFAAASTLCCTSSTDRTSTSSQYLRSAGICCRWSDDV